MTTRITRLSFVAGRCVYSLRAVG